MASDKKLGRANFTAGPWNLHRMPESAGHCPADEVGPAFDYWVRDIAAGETIVAEARAYTSTGKGFPKVEKPEEMRANADLIASAPELYAALENLLAQPRREGFSRSSVHAAIDALAKARGNRIKE